MTTGRKSISFQGAHIET